MLLSIVLAMAAGQSTEAQLRQCQIALQICSADGPVSLYPTRPARMREDVEQAAAELADTARRLTRCAERGDASDDCSREARRVRHAADDYESAVNAVR